MNRIDLEMIQGKACKGAGAWGQDDKNKQGQCPGKGGEPALNSKREFCRHSRRLFPSKSRAFTVSVRCP